MTHRITITYDRYDHQYRANLYKRVNFFGFSWWSLEFSFPGSVFNVKRWTSIWSLKHGVEVEDLTTN